MAIRSDENFRVGLAVKPKIGIIYEYQIKNNLTVKKLSECIGVSYSWLCGIMNFTIIPKQIIKGGMVEKLLYFFDCSFDDLFPSQKLKTLKREYNYFRDYPLEARKLFIDLFSINDIVTECENQYGSKYGIESLMLLPLMIFINGRQVS